MWLEAFWINVCSILFFLFSKWTFPDKSCNIPSKVKQHFTSFIIAAVYLLNHCPVSEPVYVVRIYLKTLPHHHIPVASTSKRLIHLFFYDLCALKRNIWLTTDETLQWNWRASYQSIFPSCWRTSRWQTSSLSPPCRNLYKTRKKTRSSFLT